MNEDWRSRFGGLVHAAEILGLAPYLSTPIENYRGIRARKDLPQNEARAWHARLEAEVSAAKARAARDRAATIDRQALAADTPSSRPGL